MTGQLDIFAMQERREREARERETARREAALRDLSLVQVELNAGEEWNDRAWSVGMTVLRSLELFTVNDFWTAGLPKPVEPRAIGAVLMSMARKGLCVATGRMHHSNQPGQHRRPVAEWRSLIYRQTEQEPERWDP